MLEDVVLETARVELELSRITCAKRFPRAKEIIAGVCSDSRGGGCERGRQCHAPRELLKGVLDHSELVDSSQFRSRARGHVSV